MEALEGRLALSGGALTPFAVVEGPWGTPGARLNAGELTISDASFGRPERPTLLRFDLATDAGEVAPLRRDGRAAPITQLAIGQAGSRLARMSAGSYQLDLRQGDSGGGDYRVGISLAGDVDGTYSVTRNDLRAIRSLRGVRASSPRYEAAADVNADRVINAADVRLAESNLGASTSLRPLTLRFGQSLTPSADPANDPNLYRRVSGRTSAAAGVQVTLTPRAGGRSLTLSPDGLGDFGALAVALGVPDGAFDVSVAATDPFGQRAYSTARLLDAVLVPIPGSALPAAPGPSVAGIAADTPVSVQLVTRYNPASGGTAELLGIAGAPADRREYLTPDDFAARFGTTEADLALLRRFADDYGFRVAGSDRATRTFDLETTVGRLQDAIGANIIQYDDGEGATQTGYTGPIYVPSRLGGVVDALLGVETADFGHQAVAGATPSAAGGFAGYTAPELARAYGFPAPPEGQAPGQGLSIGILELGGAVDVGLLNAYLAAQGLPAAKLNVVGTTDDPDPRANVEVMLDVEVLASVLPGASLTMYFGDNDNGHFLELIKRASFDRVNRPSILSLSWGAPEQSLSAMYVDAMDDAILDAAALGVTLFAATGDYGSDNEVGDGYADVNYPASSPYAVAVGGTTLTTQGGAWAGEVVWNDTVIDGAGFLSFYDGRGGGGSGGGGVSGFAGVPDYQSGAGLAPVSVNPPGLPGVASGPGRGLPDVAAHADPANGYLVWANGAAMTVGGTSAATPLWAALAGLVQQHTGARMGWLNPMLYQLGASTPGAFRDITSGDNVTSNVEFSPYPTSDGKPTTVLLPTHLGYVAGPGFDLASGWGSPRGEALLDALAALMGRRRSSRT